MQITVTQYGTPPLVFAKKVELQFVTLKNAMVNLGKETTDHMRMVISTQKHRRAGSEGNLEKNINFTIEDRPNKYVVGVGSLTELNLSAPYWYIINYGGMSTIAARGITLYGNFEGSAPEGRFAGTGVGRQSFSQNLPAYPMTPKYPIWAMNYLEQTANWLATIWRVHMSGVTGKIQAL